MPSLLLPSAGSEQSYSSKEADRVLQAIDLLRAERERGGEPRTLRNLVITESELNSYIAHRIATEKGRVLKELRLQLFRNGGVRGTMHFDLSGTALPASLESSMTFAFTGRISAEQGRVRFKLGDVFVGRQAVPRFLLDLAFFFASRIEKEGPLGLEEWHGLPLGIRDIHITQGKAILYY